MLVSFRSIFQAESGRRDEALETAREGFERAEASQLVYLRAEARRSLATVHAYRGEFREAIDRIEDAMELTKDSEGVVTHIWIGPVHIQVLLRLGRKDEARLRFEDYEKLIAGIQSPDFEDEVELLRGLVDGG